MIKHVIVQLRQQRAYVVNDITALTPPERHELAAWHHADLKAIMCHMIYRRQHPVGIIGVARGQSTDPWPAETIALVKLFGQLIGDLLPVADGDHGAAAPVTARSDVRAAAPPPQTAPIPADRNEACGATTGPAATPQNLVAVAPLRDLSKPMRLEKLTGPKPADMQTVFTREDGLILLTCPHCGLQESVVQSQFERVGHKIRVVCSCRKDFSAVLEKRHAHRKRVKLEGYFTIAGAYGAFDTKGSIWGPMVVKNISKTGLRFYSTRVDLLRPSDELMVRFNLDNANNSLIHKQVQVISIRDHEVGCRFKGADQYDIPLGFYFL